MKADTCNAWWLPERILQRPTLRSLGILRAGVQVRSAPWIIDYRTTPWNTLLLVLEGAFQCNFEERSLSVKGGELLVMPSGMEREIILESQAAKIAVFWLTPLTVWERFKPSCPACFPCSCGVQLQTLLMLLHQESFLGEKIDDDVVRGLSQALVGYLHRMAEETGEVVPHRQKLALAELWTAVYADPSIPWDAADLAARVHLSPTHLRRLCLRYYGYTTGEIVARIRMDIAEQLLVQGDETIEAIAQHVGYANAYSFSRAFLKTTGERPGAYQARFHPKG